MCGLLTGAPNTQVSWLHLDSATIVANHILALDSDNPEDDTPETTDEEVD